MDAGEGGTPQWAVGVSMYRIIPNAHVLQLSLLREGTAGAFDAVNASKCLDVYAVLSTLL